MQMTDVGAKRSGEYFLLTPNLGLAQVGGGQQGLMILDVVTDHRHIGDGRRGISCRADLGPRHAVRL
ncbi:MAG: hypothetical protein ACRDYY_17235 [Acidimicrobiales bacterium]